MRNCYTQGELNNPKEEQVKEVLNIAICKYMPSVKIYMGHAAIGAPKWACRYAPPPVPQEGAAPFGHSDLRLVWLFREEVEGYLDWLFDTGMLGGGFLELPQSVGGVQEAGSHCRRTGLTSQPSEQLSP